MVKCHFCGNEGSQYVGVHLLRNDGTVTFFCSSKCRKNALKLKRDKKNLKWTKFYGIEEKEQEERKAEMERKEKASSEKKAKK